MFSDGRQCTMARSDIHPSLCRFHSAREEQLFGDPAPGGHVVGAALDLPELHSACHDLTTAAGVNRALGQVFRLLAQRRISRQEAATFGHLAQLLLRTISLMRQENLTSSFEPSGSAAKGYQQDALSPLNKVADPIRSSGESHQQDELSPVNKVAPSEHREPRDLSFASPQPQPQPGTASVPSAEDPVATAGKRPTPSADESSGAVAARTVQRKPIPTTSVDDGSTSSRSLPVAHAASLSSQTSQNEDLRNSRVQLTQNEHLRKMVT